MLAEGRRALERGRDVVVGIVETHARPNTASLLDGFEVIPRRIVRYRDTELTELDVAAVLARAPRIVLVDELAHTNAPGSRNEKRWEDVEELLEAGIDVVTTVNIQHLASINDVVAEITGVQQRETVPDEVVRAAAQVQLIDMSPEALRRRMAHGNIYPPERIDAALGNYFRIGNLTALRELALLWVAGKVDTELDRYRAEHGIRATWEARERVVVALSGGPEGENLIRRAARIAARSTGSDLLAVHVTADDGLTRPHGGDLARMRTLVEELGGTYHQVFGHDVARALIDFARGVNATQLVLGASRSRRFAHLINPGVATAATALSGSIDVHLVTGPDGPKVHRPTAQRGALTGQRLLAGWLLAVLGMPALSIGLTRTRGSLGLPSDILLFLAAVVAVALVGGLLPALTAAVGGFLLLNWYFTPPLYTFTIGDHENVLALVVFILLAATVSAVVDLAARRARQAARAGADAEILAGLAVHVLRGENALPSLLSRLAETFGFSDVTLVERVGDPAPGDREEPSAWRVLATVGAGPFQRPAEAAVDVEIDERTRLLARGRVPAAGDRRVLEAFAAQTQLALRQQQLQAEADRSRPVVATDALRSAVLAAVSHDLRTPLASARAAVDSLNNPHIGWSESDRAELLATARESLVELDRLIANLLDMSRLQAGALGLHLSAVALDEVVPHAVKSAGPEAARFRIDVPDDLPEATADPALLERILVNLMTNAVRHTPPGTDVLVAASRLGDTLEIRVVDRGPGIPLEDWKRVFLPFQRLGDTDTSTGVGLGLALSRGLAEAMGGTLEPEETPGGGLTMVLSMPGRLGTGPAPTEPAAAGPA
jgi:two-component system sensor histidine kinase KdpD